MFVRAAARMDRVQDLVRCEGRVVLDYALYCNTVSIGRLVLYSSLESQALSLSREREGLLEQMF
jgi:hypothetical protein